MLTDTDTIGLGGEQPERGIAHDDEVYVDGQCSVLWRDTEVYRIDEKLVIIQDSIQLSPECTY